MDRQGGELRKKGEMWFGSRGVKLALLRLLRKDS